jgi:hypothetical protein
MARVRDSLALIPFDDGQAFLTCDLRLLLKRSWNRLKRADQGFLLHGGLLKF